MSEPVVSQPIQVIKIPGAVLPGWVIITFILCLVFASIGSLLMYARLGDMERELARLQNDNLSLHHKLSKINSWMIAVYERGSSHNWNIPDLPKETDQ